MRALAWCVSLALLVPGAGARADGGFAIAKAPYAFVFPRDHAAHDAYRTEWWYFTGHITATDGRRFGYELTFFRFGLEPHAPGVAPGQSRWRTTQLYPAHFAITDERAHTFVYNETLARGALGQGYASQRAFDVGANTWALRGTQAVMPVMQLRAAGAGGDALDLTQTPLKPPAIHGIGGISQKGPCASCASHYYSFTRLRTSGTLTSGGARYRVSGISWMDHEFGSDELMPDQTGWDWFSIQLADGRDVMLYRLRRRDGTASVQSSGSLIARDGAVRHLTLAQFALSSRGTWVSPHSHATYPSGWLVRVAGVAQPLQLTPLLADQELYDPSGTTYWEGAVDVRDARTGAALGVGYVELTGYAAPLRM